MGFGLTAWEAILVDERTQLALSDSTGLCDVLTRSTAARATIYSDINATTATQPLTFANGVVKFWTASSVTSVDLSITTANGHSLFVEAFTPSTHRILVFPERQVQTMILPYAVTASNVVANTGRVLTTAMLVREVYLKIQTSGTSVTMTVGTSTATTGFLQGVTTDTSGFRGISEAASAGLGGKGSLLCDQATATITNTRILYNPANATSGASIVYTMTTAGTQTPAGYIYIEYTRLPAF